MCTGQASPSDADRVRPIEALGAQLTAFWPYEPVEGEWSEEYVLDGMQVGVSGFTKNWLDDTISAVVDHADASVDKQMRLAAPNDGCALVGADEIERWRSHSMLFPEELAVAVVSDQLRPDRLGSWYQREALLARDDVIFLRTLCMRVEQMILGALCGLHRRLIEHPHFKWAEHLVSGMTLAPMNLWPRLRSATEGPVADAVPVFECLLDETLGLVEQHLPAGATTRVRAALTKLR